MDIKRNPPTSLEYDIDTITKFECGLYSAITDYSSRVKWLMEGTRRTFGLIRGDRIGLLLDASDANLGFGRDKAYRAHLNQLIDEQLSENLIEMLYVASYGTDVTGLWPCPMTTNWRVANEAKSFVTEQMKPSGGSNLLAGIKHRRVIVGSLQAYDGINQHGYLHLTVNHSKNFVDHIFQAGRRMLDCIVIICGSCPDQSCQHIIDYVEEFMAGYSRPLLHIVSYDCHIPSVNEFLSQLAGLRKDNLYHCFSTASNKPIYTSGEIALLIQEIHKAQSVLRIVQELRLRVENSKKMAEEAASQAVDLIKSHPPTFSLPQPVDDSILQGPLKLDELPDQDDAVDDKGQPIALNRVQPSTSEEWLERQGLKAKKLDLFQVLAPNAYSQVTGYISSIKRSVTAQVHEQCMAQIRWPDGTIKNVHVDFAQLFEYQKQLTDLVGLLEKRIHWLTKESRSYFGTLVEPQIILIIDLSQQNAVYLVHIQYCVRHLLEQQLIQKSHFNILTVGNDVMAFRPTLTPVNRRNLQAAWDWIRGVQCEGSRNLLGGLRFALENEALKSFDEQPLGIYLFTSGIPDQEPYIIESYLEQKRCGRPGLQFHVSLYNVDDYDVLTGQAIPGRYANIAKTADVFRSIAHSTHGRFHWFRETGVIESDDIRVLVEEIDRVVNYSRQCHELIDSVKNKPPVSEVNSEDMEPEKIPAQRSKSLTDNSSKQIQAIVPRLNVLTAARQNVMEQKKQALLDRIPPKTLAWYRGIKANPKYHYSSDPMKCVVKNHTGPTEDISNRTKSKSVKSTVSFEGRAAIPSQEEPLSSLDWLRKYSIRSLGLALNQLVAGAACRHNISYVSPIKSHVEARYCSGLFPIVNVAGSLRHLQYTLDELKSFENEVLKAFKRYIQRLEWLLAGSRRYFGVVTEKCVVILIDVSGSMEPNLGDLKRQLKLLVWEQLFKNHIVFNLIAFNSDIKEWQTAGPTIADETACHDAVAWIDQLEAIGGTCTGAALCRALHHLNAVDPKSGVCPGQRRPPWMQEGNRDLPCKATDDIHRVTKAIYLITDGKPDSSCSSVLREVTETWKLNDQLEAEKQTRESIQRKGSEMQKDRKKKKKRKIKVPPSGPPVHTISYTEREDANNFLKKLSQITTGRYHSTLIPSNASTQLQNLKLNYFGDTTCSGNHESAEVSSSSLDGDVQLPNFSGDDLNLIVTEARVAQRTLKKIEYFEYVYKETKCHREQQC
ncbi:unnamed protein product [Calicophoron daubneyi]|uniref:VWFA domain-containing protein n=1 Tax=Calicophoron daubneyi TaxID=300641 RepID=A0AAV2T6F1_CALDB